MITKNLFDQSLYLRFFAWMTKGLFLRTCCFLCSLLCGTFSLFSDTLLFSSYFTLFFKGQKFFHIRKLKAVKFSLYYDPVHIFRVCNIDKIKAIGGKKRSGTVIHFHMDTLRHKLRTASAIQTLYPHFQEMTICRIPAEILYSLDTGKRKLYPETVSGKFSLCIKCMLFTESLTKIIVHLAVHLVLFSFSVHQLCYGNRHFFLFKRDQRTTAHILIDEMHSPIHKYLIVCIADVKLRHHLILMA